ncbi:MAG: FAD-dependent oxidoreductase [Chloroflexota bacterium]
MKHHIVVIGAGFAGLMAAIRLSRKQDKHTMQITLINGSDDYIVRPRLHEWASNQTRQRRKLRDLLNGTDIQFMHGWVKTLHPEHKAITVETHRDQISLSYDSLIIAVGSHINTRAVAGIDDHAYVLDAHQNRGAEALRQELLTYQNQLGHVVVIGAGATGIEGATHIKSLYPQLDVTIVTQGRFGSFKDDERIERRLRHAFEQQGITVREQAHVNELTAKHIHLASGESIAYDICLWAGGFIAPSLGRDAGLQVNERNQILVDPYQCALGYPNIIAVGDCAMPIEQPGNPYRMCCPVALTMGAHAADNIVRMLSGKQEEPLSFAYYGQAIQLGTDDAIDWFSYPDDEVHGIVTTGQPALLIRNAILKYIDVIYDYEKRYGFYSWLGKSHYHKQQSSPTQSDVLANPLRNS